MTHPGEPLPGKRLKGLAKPSLRAYKEGVRVSQEETRMKFLILLIGFCLLLVLCWPLALLLLIVAPILWLISLPFRLAGLCIEAVFALLRTLLFLPARLLGYRS